MVEFCPECSNLLRKIKDNDQSFLVCKCGYKKKIILDNDKLENNLQKKKQDLEQNLVIVTQEDKISVNIKVKKECPKCAHNEAEAWQEQTRSADEPSTSFFRCVKCKFTWREY